MLSLLLHIGLKRLALFVILCCIVASPAFAQISYESRAYHKHLRKQFIKQADTTVSPYKDTHLDISSYNFKRGEPGRTRIRSEKYEYGDGTAPVKKKRFLFWKKKTRKHKKKTDN